MTKVEHDLGPINTGIEFICGCTNLPCIGCVPGACENRRFKFKGESKSSIIRPSKDTYYLDIALAVSKRGACLKRHYGCVIVKDDIIVATGYNGSPRGQENCCDRGTCKRANAERYTSYEQCDSVHAEQNALIAASYQQLQGATLYLACEEYGLNEEKSAMREEDIHDFHEDKNPIPCPLCTRMLRNSGIIRVVNRRGDIQCL